MNKLIEKFNNKEKILGTISHIKSMTAIEALGYTGVDFIMLDMEHSPLDTDEAAKYLTAATAANLPALIRVSSMNKEHILHMLDAGAAGIVVPSVTNVQQVKELIKYAKFTPVGERGYCMTRDGGWGFAENSKGTLRQYMDYSNKNTLLIPQCETVGCLENIEEITSLEGVDGILVGPYDLSIDMGIAGEFDNPKLTEAILRIITACKKNKKMAIGFAGNTNAAVDQFKDGYDAVLFGIDLIMYINTYKNSIKEIKDKI